MAAPLVPIGHPYSRPKCRVGESLECVRRGRVAVDGFTEAPVPWPYVTNPNGVRSLIVCGDLARAVRTEAPMVVANLFGVSRRIVAQWRRWLGVDYPTGGTRDRAIAAKRRPGRPAAKAEAKPTRKPRAKK